MVRVPNMKQPGKATKGIVESLDLYPTLAVLCDLQTPPGLNGQSLRPLIDNPAHPGKNAAFGYWRNGRTMRTDRWRITEYPKVKKGAIGVELYDHTTDQHEINNVAGQQPQVVKQLLATLKQDAPTLRDD